MDSFFKRLLIHRDKLSNLEKQVLEYMMEKPERLESHTLDELAKEIFVSTATISRTCKKLGFSGFQEMKYSIQQHRDEAPDRMTYTQSHSLEQHIARFEKETANNLQLMKKMPLEEMVALLKQSNRVEFFGVGNSYPPCFEGARKLTFAGKIATARSDWDELRVVARNLNKDDLAIVVSLSGETLYILEYATILKERQVPILALVASRGSHLEELATLTVHLEVDSYYNKEFDLSSRYPFNTLLDLLTLGYINDETSNNF